MLFFLISVLVIINIKKNILFTKINSYDLLLEFYNCLGNLKFMIVGTLIASLPVRTVDRTTILMQLKFLSWYV